MDKIKYLSRIQLFQELELEELKQIEPVTPIRVVKKGSIIASPYMDSKILYLIKSGTVRLYKLSGSGKELTLDLLGKGHVFGEFGSFTTGSENMYAQAWEDCVICKMEQPQLEQILREHPQLSLKLIEIISNRLKEVEELLEYMAYGSVRRRLLYLLRKMAEKFGTNWTGTGRRPDEDGWIQLDISITHQELAAMMGSVRETVTALLNELTKEHIVRRAGNRKPLQIHWPRLVHALESEE